MFIKLPKTDWEKDCKVEEYIIKLANKEVRRVVQALRDLDMTKEEIYSLFEGVDCLYFTGRKKKAMELIYAIYGIVGMLVPDEVYVVGFSNYLRGSFVSSFVSIFDCHIVPDWCSEVRHG